jgi:hypothetical protein
MGNISTILAAILCATAPLSAIETLDPKTEAVQSSFKLGRETVSSIRNAYEKGEYDEFLSEMDSSYKNADLSGLIQMRDRDIPVEFQEDWEQRFIDLRAEKNKELLSVISDEDDSLFSQKVRSVASQITTPEQEKALTRLNSFIVLSPGKGANEDENVLISLDVEYEYKLMHASMPSSDLSLEQQLQHQVALRMEKMDRMIAASKNFQDPALKQAVSIASATLDERLARNLDGSDLNALVKGKVKPSNPTEERVYSILSLYQAKFSELMKELDHANQ